jgi:hypothetical protein
MSKTQLHPTLAVLVLALSASGSALAQTGGGSGGCSVGRGFECIELTAHEGTGTEERNWLRAVILWRHASTRGSGRSDTAASREAAQRTRDARRAAEDSGRVFLGGSFYGRTYSAAHSQRYGRPTTDTLYVLGRVLSLPLRDSALIVMIDGLEDGVRQPTLVGTEWMPAILETRYWPKHWRSGDTTFSVMPRGQEVILRAALLAIPSVRGFLERAP